MTDREKLIYLIGQVQDEGRDYAEPDTVYIVPNEKIADHLIANGVTFATDTNDGRKWIPVTERLPRTWEDVLTYRHENEDRVWIEWRDRRGKWSCDNPDDFDPVTHWMPLPEPPEEVE